MREDQYMGLTHKAQELLGLNEKAHLYVEKRIFPDGRELTRNVTGTRTVCELSGGRFYGMYDVQYNLHKYTLPDGRVYTEFVQAAPWSSGPMFFIALKDEDGNEVEESLWSQKDINEGCCEFNRYDETCKSCPDFEACAEDDMCAPCDMCDDTGEVWQAYSAEDSDGQWVPCPKCRRGQ